MTDDEKEIIEDCLYTFASLVATHHPFKRDEDVAQCLAQIERGLKALEAPHD